MPVRLYRPAGDRAHRAARMHQRHLALPPAGRRSRPGLWLARLRAVGAEGGAPLQRCQAPDRSLCALAGRRPRLGRRPLRLHDRRRRRCRSRQGRARFSALHPQGAHLPRNAARRHEPSAQFLAEDGDLRGACARAHHAPPLPRRGGARHLRGDVDAGDDRLSRTSRHHRDRVHAGSGLHAGPPSGRAWPRQLLGLQHAVLLRTRAALSRRKRAGGHRHRGRPAASVRDRGDPRRRVQSHLRRQSFRADPVVARHRQCSLLPPPARQSALLRQSDGRAETR